jgi:hypothetical protein
MVVEMQENRIDEITWLVGRTGLFLRFLLRKPLRTRTRLHIPQLNSSSGLTSKRNAVNNAEWHTKAIARLMDFMQTDV